MKELIEKLEERKQQLELYAKNNPTLSWGIDKKSRHELLVALSLNDFDIIIQALTSVKSEPIEENYGDKMREKVRKAKELIKGNSPSVESEKPNKLEINANPENGIVFYADSVKGNGLHFDSPSVKSDSAEDKKQHAIEFACYIPNVNYWTNEELDSLYNEYLNTLNNK